MKKLVGVICALAMMMGPVGASETAQPRTLSFYHTHTGERLTVVYYDGGEYVDAALSQINHLLRDFRNNEVANIDPATLDIVYQVQQQAGHAGEVHIISAYRSPETNEMLRSKSNGVARNSMHLQGRAIDFRLPGVDTAKLREIALELKLGGVGYYKSSDFIHVDNGRVRFW